MARKGERCGLLSRLALIFRRLTGGRSLEESSVPIAGGALREKTFESNARRRRRNDLVRKQEFDKLRLLRDRGPGFDVGPHPDCSGQASSLVGPDPKAEILRKIDAVEMQVSREWWQAKREAGNPAQDRVPPSSE
jgi:hypothetical protein